MSIKLNFDIFYFFYYDFSGYQKFGMSIFEEKKASLCSHQQITQD